VFQIKGSNKRFPAVKESYVTDAQDLAKRSVMDGDTFMAATSPSWRFRCVQCVCCICEKAAAL
jgi:hypothetical protein